MTVEGKEGRRGRGVREREIGKSVKEETTDDISKLSVICALMLRIGDCCCCCACCVVGVTRFSQSQWSSP